MNFATDSKVKVGVLHPVQQPGSYWDIPTAFATCGSQTHTEVTACIHKDSYS